MKLNAPSVATWLPKFAADILALFKQRLDRPLWLFGAPTAGLPTLADMGANEGAIAYDETLDHPVFYDGSAWNQLYSSASSLLTIGSGEEFSPFTGATTGYLPDPRSVDVRIGSEAAPDLVPGQGLRVARTVSITDAALVAAGAPNGANPDGMAAVAGYAKGTTTNEAQVVGVFGSALNGGAANSPTLSGTSVDACGIYGIGVVSGPGVGIGGYFRGIRGSTSSYVTGIEIQAYNAPASVAAYSSSSFNSCGIWMSAAGDGDTPVGLHINNPFGRQFTHGIAFGSQVTGGKTGGVLTTSILDDSNSVTSIDINGSHTNAIDTAGATLSGYAIQMASGHAVAWSTDTGLVRSAAGVVKVTDGASGSGALFAGTIELGNASDTTLARSSAGNVSIEGNVIYRVGGADVSVADGGTGASTLTGLLQGNGTSAVTTVTNSTTVGQILRVTGSNTYAFGAADLADTDAITGTLPVANGGTGDTGTAWTDYSGTCTLTPGAGTFTNASIVVARYKQIGKTVFVRISILITTNGTANSYFTITAPVTPANVSAQSFQPIYCTTTGTAGYAGRAALDNNSTTIYVTKYDGTYLGQDGMIVHLEGVYEAA